MNIIGVRKALKVQSIVTYVGHSTAKCAQTSITTNITDHGMLFIDLVPYPGVCDSPPI